MRKSSKSVQRYIPQYVHNPLRLGLRLLTHREPAARSAALMAIAGIGLAPLDKFLEIRENKLYREPSSSVLPILLVCGPPRSGTTLVSQYLINNLEVDYFNNLSSLFPRSPLYANRLFSRWLKPQVGPYRSFYGKTTSLHGSNDGLYVWDRWLGPDRDRVPDELLQGASDSIVSFFAAMQAQRNLPVVNKANRILAAANLIAPILPNARIICLRRNPVMLAQSLLIAREQLIGSRGIAYGLDAERPPEENPIEDVCHQVEWLNKLIERQHHFVGEDQFKIVDYEEFCRKPAEIIDRLLQEWNLVIKPRHKIDRNLSFAVSKAVRVPQSDFDSLQSRLAHLGSGALDTTSE